MSTEVKLNQLRTVIDPLDYPIATGDVLDAVGDVRLRYADGEERLGDVVERAETDVYETVEDLEADVYNNLPTEAVGEPGQSEGEG